MKRIAMLLVCVALAVSVSAAYAEESGCFQSTDNWIIRVYSEGTGSPYKIMLAVIDPGTGLRVPHSSIKAFAGATPACKNLDRAISHLCEIESFAQNPDLSLGCDQTAGAAYIIHDQAGYPTISTIPDLVKSSGPAPGMLEVTPAFLAFGKVAQGKKTLSATVYNNGPVPLNISTVTPPSAPFRKTADSCTGAFLAASTGSCSISITFAPVAGGSYAGSFSIVSDGGSATVQLTGAK